MIAALGNDALVSDRRDCDRSSLGEELSASGAPSIGRIVVGPVLSTYIACGVRTDTMPPTRRYLSITYRTSSVSFRTVLVGQPVDEYVWTTCRAYLPGTSPSIEAS
jgi:hypothetical protein